MHHRHDRLLKENLAAASATGDEQIDQRLRDADGKQLVQGKNAAPGDRTEEIELPQPSNVDLDLASTEHHRAARSRTIRRR
jgi:hypothetical protein